MNEVSESDSDATDKVTDGAARLNEVSESDSDATDKVTDGTREEIPEADSNEGTSGLSA